MLENQLIQIFYVNTLPSQQRLADIHQFISPFSSDKQSQLIEQKINQKWLKSVDDGSLLIDEMGEVFLIANGMKVNPNWQSLQQRVVKAGKKSELLLKAMQLQAGMNVIDATAGFGHDSLILASTGANVFMIEQHPLMYLLLKLEQQKMSQQPNWQKLMSRLTIYQSDASQLFAQLPTVDRIYLDPMFPAESYKAAVNKNMQILHSFTTPPSIDQEHQLLLTALQQISTDGMVLVKRPQSAAFLANQIPDNSQSNAIVRFDTYLNKKAVNKKS